MEETAKICKFRAHENFLAVFIVIFIFLYKTVNILVCRDHNVVIAVVLHYLKNLYLMCSQTSSIAVDQIPKEIHKFAFIIAIFSFSLNILTDHLYEFEDSDLLIEHSLVVVIHFFEEIDATDVSTYVVNHLGNVSLKLSFYLIKVLD